MDERDGDRLVPEGPLRVDARSTRILLGATLACVMPTRLGWRTTGRRHLPAAEAGLPGVAAEASHLGLYALLVVTPALGVFNAWVRGDSLFGVLRIPAFDPGNDALRHRVQDLHGLSANLLLALAALHAAAALWHRFHRHDAVLDRMLTDRRGGQ